MIDHYDLLAEDWHWNGARKIYNYGGHLYGKHKLEIRDTLVHIYEKDSSNVLHPLVFKGKIPDRETLVLVMELLNIKPRT